MNLSNLHTRETVIKAIREYDRLGREAFLSKYGFGKAREYYLLHEGKYYDSKAITAVAYGYDNPSHGPLMSSEFSGGKNTVQNRLEKLGFTVVQMSSKPRKGKRNLIGVGLSVISRFGDMIKLIAEIIVQKKQVAVDIAELVGRTWKSVEYKFQNIAHFDTRRYEHKPYSPKHNVQKLLGEVFEWYWSDRDKNRLFYDK